MRSLKRRAAVFAAIQLCILAVVAATYVPSRTMFVGACRAKHALAGGTTEPKVLLVGGSSIAFGVHSPTLQRALAAPVVNLGGHAGQGLTYRLREANAFVRPSDTIVMSFEYEPLGGFVDGAILLQSWEAGCRPWRFMDFGSVKAVLDNAHAHARFATPRWLLRLARGRWSAPKAPYSSDSINPLGDTTAHYDMPPVRLTGEDLGTTLHWARVRSHVAAIREHAQRWTERGARVFYAFPFIPPEKYERAEGELKKLAAYMRRELPTVSFLNDLESSVRPPEEFFDTAYHLTGAAAMARTRRLADRLRPPEAPIRRLELEVNEGAARKRLQHDSPPDEPRVGGPASR